MSCAYSGAPKLTPMISRNRPSAATAIRFRHSRRQANAQGLRPLISGSSSEGSCAGGSADSVSAIAIGGCYFSHCWSIRMYHCGFHWYPWTRLDRKSICLGLYMSTHGAWSVTA